jgi:hypothetical protein
MGLGIVKGAGRQPIFLLYPYPFPLPCSAWQRHAPLAHVLPAAILVRDLADLVGLEEDHLRHTLVRIDLGGQRRGVGELERHVPFPLGFEWRDVDDDPAARIGRFAEAHRQHVTRDAEILDRPGKRERIRRDDADLAREVHERTAVKILRIDDGRVDVREDLELRGAAHVVAVARGAVGNDALAVRDANLAGLEGLDHAVALGHAADPAVGLDAHVQVSSTVIVGAAPPEVAASESRAAVRRAMSR